jgi:serine/threonine protein kinase
MAKDKKVEIPEPAPPAQDVTTTDVPGTVYKSTLPKGRMMFGEAIEIDTNERIPKYSNMYVSAYPAKSLGTDGRDFIAYVCEPQYTPRNRLGPAYAAVANPSLLHLIGSGIGKMPDHGINRFVFIYENALGKPIVETDQYLAVGMKSERVMEKIVTPMISVLKDLRDHDIVHGAIRATNMFDGGKEHYDHVVLGEGLSLPPSMSQPMIYEPVDRALAQPTGRGLGTNQDDLYSLGVTIAMLLRSKDPMKGKTDAEIIQNKMQYGTYSTLLGSDEHISSAMLELLRGLLHDDRNARWTLDEVLTWMDGRRLSPKQSAKKLRAARPMEFNGKTYSFPSALARDLFQRPSEAVQLIESGDLYQWIKRSLDDEMMLNRFDAAVSSAEEAGRGNGYWDRLLSRIVICLDPDGPIRYKNVSLTGEGISTALAEAFVTNQNLPIYAELFSGTLLSYWMTTLTDLNYDMAGFVTRFEPSRNYIKQPGPGFGLERVLYYLNPDVHCLSPAVSRYYARSPEEFLNACEEMAADPARRPARLMDRHSIAFLCVKDRKVAEPYLYDLASNEPYRYALGTLQCLAAIQKYYRIPMLKNLTQWMSEFIEPVFARFHDRDVRRDLRKKVNEVRDKGDLNKLLAVLDNAELLRSDLTNFRYAMRHYRALVAEREDLTMRVNDSKFYGRREGRETAVIVAGLIATVLMAGIVILYLNGARIL